MTREELDAALRPLLDEIVAINRRYNFAHDGRAPEDEARFYALVSEKNALVDAFDAANPLPPCPACGEPRSAFLGEQCWRVGRCPLAPHGAGG